MPATRRTRAGLAPASDSSAVRESPNWRPAASSQSSPAATAPASRARPPGPCSASTRATPAPPTAPPPPAAGPRGARAAAGPPRGEPAGEAGGRRAEPLVHLPGLRADLEREAVERELGEDRLLLVEPPAPEREALALA